MLVVLIVVDDQFMVLFIDDELWNDQEGSVFVFVEEIWIVLILSEFEDWVDFMIVDGVF